MTEWVIELIINFAPFIVVIVYCLFFRKKDKD